MNTLDILYSAAGIALSPLWARKPRSGWAERFGRTPPIPRNQVDRARVMVHAVSVGEVNALRGLVPALARRCEVVVSASTDTGLARAKELYSAIAHVVRYPLDFSASVSRFLEAINPDAVGLVELEVWPNFIAECGRRDIPVGVINGRLSPRSFRGYRRIRRVIGPTFSRLAFAAAQDSDYAERFVAMGVPRERCTVTGSMKWDAVKIEDAVPGAEDLAVSLGIDRRRPLVVAGSTGPGEERLFHASCSADVQLLCAPRKPERFDEAAEAMPGCVRRSRTRSGEAPAFGARRFLLDTIGELRLAYSLADVVVMGRSFGDLHGSDPVEPVALGKPTIIGPAYGDFLSAVDALREAGAIVVSSRESLASDIANLLGDALRREALAVAGRQCVHRHQGATTRHEELLWGLVEARRGTKPVPSGATIAP